MSTTREIDDSVNEEFELSKNQEIVFDIFREEYQTSPSRIREVTDLRKQRINEALDRLQAAGWIEKIAHGLYRTVYDGEGYVEQRIEYVEPEDA